MAKLRRVRIRRRRDGVLPFAGVADHVHAVTVDDRAHVLDGSTEIVVDVVNAQRHRAAQLEVHAAVEAVLVHRLDVRIGIENEGLTQIPEAGGAAPEIAPRHVAQIEAGDIERVERAVVGVPEVAAKRPACDLVLRPVVVPAPARKRLHASVTAHVIRGAETWRQLVAEAELEGVFGDVRPEGRNLLVLRADAEIQREP